MDFMSDALQNGRRFGIFTLVDNFSRVSPAAEVDFSLTGKRIVEVLERVKQVHGLPEIIHCDNGSEFISRVVDDWAHRNGVKLDFSWISAGQVSLQTTVSSNRSMDDYVKSVSISTGLTAWKQHGRGAEHH
jgi:hypothetical protein